MFRLLTSLTLLLLLTVLASAQIRIADGLPGCLTPINFMAAPDPGCAGNFSFFGINGSNQVEVNNVDGLVCCGGSGDGGSSDAYFEFPIIDISNFANVTLRMNYSAMGNFEDTAPGPQFGCSGNTIIDNGHDQIIFQVSVDGGGFTFDPVNDYIHGTTAADFTGTWNSPTSYNGNTLQLRVVVANKAASEFFFLDNLIVEGDPTFTAGPDLSGCPGQAVFLQGMGNGTWSGGVGTYSNVNDPMSTYTVSTSDVSPLTLTYTSAPVFPGCQEPTDNMEITFNNITANLSGGSTLCPGECADVSVLFAGGIPPYTIDLEFSSTVIPIPIPITVPGFNVNDVITVCYNNDQTLNIGGVPIPFNFEGLGGTLSLLAVSDNGGCNNIPQNSQVTFDFLSKPEGNTASMEVCESEFGDGEFDFSVLVNDILGGIAGTVEFYDDISLTNQIFPPYIGVSTTIYAVVIDANGCTSDPIPIDLILKTNGDAGNINFQCNGGFTCTICDSDGIPGEDIELTLDFEDVNRDYEVEITYFAGGIQNDFIGTLPGTGGSFFFTITENTIFQVIAVTPSDDCTDRTDMPASIEVTYLIQPDIDDLPALSDCNPITLPAITGQNLTGLQFYNTQPDGTGVTYAPGDIIASNLTLYAIDGSMPDCADVEQLDIEIGASQTLIPPASDSICGIYTFPVPPGKDSTTSVVYSDEPGGLGTIYAIGDTLFISDTIYVTDPGATCPTNDTSFSIFITSAIIFDSINDLTSCLPIELPAITGQGVSDSVKYYTEPNGMGTVYLPGDTIFVTDTLYLFDSETNCDQENTIVLVEVGVGISYGDPGTINTCDFYELEPITGSNVLSTAMYFTAPNGGGTGLVPGDTVRSNITLYVFDTTTICNENQPILTVNIQSTPTYDIPQIIETCGSYTLPAITGQNLNGNEFYNSGPFGSGVDIPAGTTFTSDTIIYISNIPNTCPLEQQIRISIADFNPGTANSLVLCIDEEPLNLFDALIPPFTPGGDWSEITTNNFDLTDPMNVDIANDQGGIYEFGYTLSAPGCPTVQTRVNIELVRSPGPYADSTLVSCGNPGIIDLAPFIPAPFNTLNFESQGGEVPILGSNADFNGLPDDDYTLFIIASNESVNGIVMCPDTLTLTVSITSGPNAGDDLALEVCENEIIDLSTLLTNNDLVGIFESPTPNVLNGSLFDPAQSTDDVVIVSHIVDIGSGCEPDTAELVITILEGADAGLDLNVSECGVGNYDLNAYVFNNPGGDFEVVSGNYTITNGTIAAGFPGIAEINYILDSGCKPDTALITLTIFNVGSGSFVDYTCAQAYDYFGTIFTPSNNSGTVNLPGSNGCDSMVLVTINFGSASINTVAQTLCANDSIILNNVVYNSTNPSGRDTLEGQSFEGCDSIIIVNLDFEDVAEEFINVNTCDEDFSTMVGNELFDFNRPSGQVLLENQATNGCDSIVNVSLNIEPFIYEVVTESPQCDGDLGSLTITQFGGTNLLRVTVNGEQFSISDMDLPFTITLPPGNYPVLIETEDQACDDTIDVTIQEVIPPFVEITSESLSDSTWQLGTDSDTGITTFFWTSIGGSLSCFDCPDPIFTGTGTITLIYDYGITCVGDTSLLIEREVDNDFLIPNAISLRQGGSNGTFSIVFSDNTSIIISQFVILDRWGNVMTKVENIQPSGRVELWNGTMNGQQVNPGVYVMSLTYFDGEQVKSIIKDITVIR